MRTQVTDLFQSTEHIPVVAQWIYDAFWADKEEYTPAEIAELLRGATASDSIPLSLLAWADGQPAGTVNLVENDDPERLHLRPWLAALVVAPAYRGRGIGTALVNALCSRARSIGIQTLYLSTDNPGFYERLGAHIHEQPPGAICIMTLPTEQGSK